MIMGQKYWLGRETSALSMASKAATSEARLLHFQLAGHYSVKAASLDPFMLPAEMAREVLCIASDVTAQPEVTSFFVLPSAHKKTVASQGFWQSCLQSPS
jgi:hypothetical protein